MMLHFICLGLPPTVCRDHHVYVIVEGTGFRARKEPKLHSNKGQIQGLSSDLPDFDAYAVGITLCHILKTVVFFGGVY